MDLTQMYTRQLRKQRNQGDTALDSGKYTSTSNTLNSNTDKAISTEEGKQSDIALDSGILYKQLFWSKTKVSPFYDTPSSTKLAG